MYLLFKFSQKVIKPQKDKTSLEKKKHKKSSPLQKYCLNIQRLWSKGDKKRYFFEKINN